MIFVIVIEFVPLSPVACLNAPLTLPVEVDKSGLAGELKLTTRLRWPTEKDKNARERGRRCSPTQHATCGMCDI